MQITKVRIFPVHENRLRAYVSITLDNCFVVRDLKIIEGDRGLFVAMPAKRRHDGTYRDIAHPLDSNTRAVMEEKILQTYINLTENQGLSSDKDRKSDDDSEFY